MVSVYHVVEEKNTRAKLRMYKEYNCFLCFYLLVAVFLLNGAAVFHDKFFSLVSVGHVVENTRLVDVDGGATAECDQAVSFVVVHGRVLS